MSELSRSQEEILARFKKTDSPFGFDREVLLGFLEYHAAMAGGILKDGVAEADWPEPQACTRDAALEQAKAYMAEYGWPKCEGHRGISASRTIEKMVEWIWLAGDDEFSEQVMAMTDTHYAQYGAPILKAICERYKWPIPQDNMMQRMMRGEPCGLGDCGCGE